MVKVQSVCRFYGATATFFITFICICVALLKTEFKKCFDKQANADKTYMS